VPQSIYPESFHSSLSGPLNTLLKTKLREHALVLRRLRASLLATTPAPSTDEVTAALRAKKEELMQEVYTVMTATLGVPIRPDQTFNWEYYEDGPGGNGKAKAWQGTPREFYTTIAQGKYKVCRGKFCGFRKKDIHVCPCSRQSRFRLSTIHETTMADFTPSTSSAMFGAADRCYVGRSAVHKAHNPYLVVVDVNTDIENLKNAVVKVLFSPFCPQRAPH
jgi:hypothetical protein